MLLFNAKKAFLEVRRIYFNTSNVTIQPLQSAYIITSPFYFNTSNVTIQLTA